MLMSDGDEEVETHHPPVTSKEKKEIEMFLAMMRKKDMRNKRRDRFDDDDRSDQNITNHFLQVITEIIFKIQSQTLKKTG